MNNLGEAEDTGNPTIQRHDSSQKGIHQGNSESPSPSPMGLGAEITNHRGQSSVPCLQDKQVQWLNVSDNSTTGNRDEEYGLNELGGRWWVVPRVVVEVWSKDHRLARAKNALWLSSSLRTTLAEWF